MDVNYDAVESGECGPASASAGSVQGDPAGSKVEAAKKALDLARSLAAAACEGTCPQNNQTCVYKETKASIDSIEVNGDPTGGTLMYIAKATSSGTCGCK